MEWDLEDSMQNIYSFLPHSTSVEESMHEEPYLH